MEEDININQKHALPGFEHSHSVYNTYINMDPLSCTMKI